MTAGREAVPRPYPFTQPPSQRTMFRVKRLEGERRQKGSGRVIEVPCRWCEARVTIDRQAMQFRDGRPHQVCQGCQALVPLRHGDAYAPFSAPGPHLQQSRPTAPGGQTLFDRELATLLGDLQQLQNGVTEASPEAPPGSARKSNKRRSRRVARLVHPLPVAGDRAMVPCPDVGLRQSRSLSAEVTNQFAGSPTTRSKDSSLV